jgi:uncharacterized OsmC-like protein
MRKLNELMEAIKKDPNNGKITPIVVGDWVFEEGQPQFRSEIEVEGGKFTIEADMPSKLGGWGSQPGPLHWCLYGLASCYAFTFAALSAMEGVSLNKLSVTAKGHIDFSKVFGLSENPIVEQMNFTVKVDSDTGLEKLEQLKKQADEKCPAVFCLTQHIKISTQLIKE